MGKREWERQIRQFRKDAEYFQSNSGLGFRLKKQRFECGARVCILRHGVVWAKFATLEEARVELRNLRREVRCGQ
jgi:hypothetical protein